MSRHFTAKKAGATMLSAFKTKLPTKLVEK
jgi:hypothetical protein